VLFIVLQSCSTVSKSISKVFLVIVADLGPTWRSPAFFPGFGFVLFVFFIHFGFWPQRQVSTCENNPCGWLIYDPVTRRIVESRPNPS